MRAPALPHRNTDARLSARTYELTQFLVHVLGVTNVGAHYEGKVAYHASCHLLRELGERASPKALLEKVVGAELVPLPGSETVCCGFGGTFSVSFPHISAAMGDLKLEHMRAVQPDVVVSPDMSCMMHITGLAAKEGKPIKAMHVAQVLRDYGMHERDEAPQDSFAAHTPIPGLAAGQVRDP